MIATHRSYFHKEIQILHNDIKPSLDPDNSSLYKSTYQADFGKSRPVLHGRRYHLSESEKVQHLRRYRYVAPEMVNGETKQTTASEQLECSLIIGALKSSLTK